MEYMDDIEGIDEDIAWADPAIRTEYEAAPGRFILAFNEADYRLSQVIAAELAKLGHSDLAETATKGNFAQRLEKLELLVSSTKDQQLSAPISTSNTRFNPRAQLIATCRGVSGLAGSATDAGGVAAPRPRCAGVTVARY